jgi:hypothetical protein
MSVYSPGRRFRPEGEVLMRRLGTIHFRASPGRWSSSLRNSAEGITTLFFPLSLVSLKAITTSFIAVTNYIDLLLCH